MVESNEKILFEQIKVALGKSTDFALPGTLNWDTLFYVSMKQCVPAIVLDGLNKSLASERVQNSEELDVWQTRKLKWFGVMLNIEKQYAKHESTIADLAAFYQKNGFRMMLLKGYGLSKYWPIPNHRPTGDIDIYLMNDDSSTIKNNNQPAWKQADKVIKEKLGIKADDSHHHHTVFTYKGTMVENHFDFVNVHSHHSNRWIEKEFKRLALVEYEEYSFCNGSKIVLPSPLLNCLFVARHNAIHFAAEHLNLRQLLDWALLVENRHRDVDWCLFWSLCKQMGMERFVLCMVAIAVERLSFSQSIFHIPDEHTNFFNDYYTLIDRVLDNILHPTDGDSNGKGLVYIVKRFKLWRSNLWKHRIVYTDSILSTFLAQLQSHLMKPSTIFGT